MKSFEFSMSSIPGMKSLKNTDRIKKKTPKIWIKNSGDFQTFVQEVEKQYTQRGIDLQQQIMEREESIKNAITYLESLKTNTLFPSSISPSRLNNLGKQALAFEMETFESIMQSSIREPISEKDFPLFLVCAGDDALRKKEEKMAQLSLIFVLLYSVDLKMCELEFMGKKELDLLLNEGEIVLPFRNKKKILSQEGRALLKKYQHSIDFLFLEKNFKTITCSVYDHEKNMDIKQLIRMVNKEIRRISEKYQINKNYSTRSFRLLWSDPLHIKENTPSIGRVSEVLK